MFSQDWVKQKETRINLYLGDWRECPDLVLKRMKLRYSRLEILLPRLCTGGWRYASLSKTFGWSSSNMFFPSSVSFANCLGRRSLDYSANKPPTKSITNTGMRNPNTIKMTKKERWGKPCSAKGIRFMRRRKRWPTTCCVIASKRRGLKLNDRKFFYKYLGVL